MRSRLQQSYEPGIAAANFHFPKLSDPITLNRAPGVLGVQFAGGYGLGAL
jgi:hypothetical protein